MNAEISPEPTDEERRALLAAVSRLHDAESPPRSGWRDAERGDEDDVYAAAWPRSKRGATRA